MTQKAKQRRFPLQLSAEEAEAVTEYRWKNRIPSQTEAVRRLVAKGLELENAQVTSAPTT